MHSVAQKSAWPAQMECNIQSDSLIKNFHVLKRNTYTLVPQISVRANFKLPLIRDYEINRILNKNKLKTLEKYN